jgi:hypothetical protein
LVNGEMRREVELALAYASGSELFLKSSINAECANGMLLRIGNKKSIRANRNGARPLKMIGYLEPQFAVFAKDNDFAQSRIRHKERAISFCNRYGREKAHWTNLFPTMPLPGFPIVKANGVSAGIREAKVLIFVERQAERFLQHIGSSSAAGQPSPEAREGGRFCAEVRRSR